MASNTIVRILPPPTSQSNNPTANRWIGRIAIFELVTGTRIQGRILAASDEWIDTDNGAIKVQHIVSAKWVSQEEAQIIRGGPMQPWDPSRQLR